ncbi:MAG: transposon-transfer assisting family protein [Faecalimonas umbilicata]|uniref:transposon-transfer assisting family protein n=1 Tax=Faecalimonas umbilicata TaxID=1912855 RepID=UPI00300ECBD4
MMMFNVEEQNLLAVLHADTREATIADIRMVLNNIDDLELEELCSHTLDKLMKISDEEYAALDLEVDEGFAYEE